MKGGGGGGGGRRPGDGHHPNSGSGIPRCAVASGARRAAVDPKTGSDGKPRRKRGASEEAFGEGWFSWAGGGSGERA